MIGSSLLHLVRTKRLKKDGHLFQKLSCTTLFLLRQTVRLYFVFQFLRTECPEDRGDIHLWISKLIRQNFACARSFKTLTSLPFYKLPPRPLFSVGPSTCKKQHKNTSDYKPPGYKPPSLFLLWSFEIEKKNQTNKQKQKQAQTNKDKKKKTETKKKQ